MYDDPDVDNCQNLVQRDVHLDTGSSVAAVRGTVAHLQFIMITMLTVNDVKGTLRNFMASCPEKDPLQGCFHC